MVQHAFDGQSQCQRLLATVRKIHLAVWNANLQETYNHGLQQPEPEEELVKDFFSRVGDIAYNYNVKKPNAEIMGDVLEVPEDEVEDNAAWLAIPEAQRQAAHKR